MAMPIDSDAPLSWELRPVAKRGSTGENMGEVPDYVLDDGGGYTLCIHDEALNGMRTYAATDMQNEVGGVLLGRRITRGERVIVVVESHLALKSANSSRTHFEFDDNALLSLHQALAARAQGQGSVVGWFHTHVRIGDPFMSTIDEELHRRHFREPWHVSCVVGNGEWSMPVGFWRMEGHKLIRIKDYSALMHGSTRTGGETRRMFRSCFPEPKTTPTVFEDALGLLADLGVEVGHGLKDLRTVLDRHRDDGIFSKGSFVPVSESILLCARIAKDAAAISEAERLSSTIASLQLEREALTPVLLCGLVKAHVAVNGNLAVATSGTDGEVVYCDLARNVVLPVHVSDGSRFRDVCFASAGFLWLVTDTGHVVSLDQGAIIETDDGPRFSRKLRYSKVALQIDQVPERVWETAGRLWVLTSSHVYAYRSKMQGPTPDNRFPYEVTYPLGQGDYCPLSSPAGQTDAVLLCRAHDRLRLLGSDLSVLRESEPDGMLVHWKLEGAAFGASGILALFVNREKRFLGVLDENNLAFRRILVARNDGRLGEALRSVTVDSLGRAFVMKTNGLYILTSSGSLSSKSCFGSDANHHHLPAVTLTTEAD